jgi:hypothetical protein
VVRLASVDVAHCNSDWSERRGVSIVHGPRGRWHNTEGAKPADIGRRRTELKSTGGDNYRRDKT